MEEYKLKQACRKKNLCDRRIILLREEIWTPITLYMKCLCHDRKVNFSYWFCFYDFSIGFWRFFLNMVLFLYFHFILPVCLVYYESIIIPRINISVDLQHPAKYLKTLLLLFCYKYETRPYSRNESCALILISTFLWINQVPYTFKFGFHENKYFHNIFNM